jgi:HEPN domain-containing protein
MSTPPDPSVVLLDKALEDAYLARRVKDDANVSVEQIGFLCEQAIEKSLKAVLSYHNVQFRRGHDLAQYLDLLKAANVVYPPELDKSVELTPFGAELRYDYLPKEQQETAPFDREATLRLVDQAIEWAKTIVSGGR